MSGLYTVAAAICASSVIVAVLSHFVTDGGTKKLLSLVMGAFLVCAMLAPVRNAVSGIAADWDMLSVENDAAATDDEAYNRRVLAQTRENLETALADILAQNGISVNRAEIVLSLTGENRIIISQISIYINEASADESDRIARLTEEHFTVRPTVITE